MLQPDANRWCTPLPIEALKLHSAHSDDVVHSAKRARVSDHLTCPHLMFMAVPACRASLVSGFVARLFADSRRVAAPRVR